MTAIMQESFSVTQFIDQEMKEVIRTVSVTNGCEGEDNRYPSLIERNSHIIPQSVSFKDLIDSDTNKSFIVNNDDFVFSRSKERVENDSNHTSIIETDKYYPDKLDLSKSCLDNYIDSYIDNLFLPKTTVFPVVQKEIHKEHNSILVNLNSNKENESDQDIQIISEIITNGDECIEVENSLNEINKRKKKNKSRVFQCHICGYSSRYQLIFDNHVSSHSVDNVSSIYSCTICDYKTQYSSMLIRHITYKHSDQKPVQCSFCQNKYKSALHLHNHMASHTSENIICTVCNIACKSAQEYENHQFLHEKENIFRCYCCGKQFTSASGLADHIQAHIDDARNDLTVFSCHYCGYVTTSKLSYKRHLISHSSKLLSCNFCNSNFDSLLILFKHMKIAHKFTIDNIP